MRTATKQPHVSFSARSNATTKVVGSTNSPKIIMQLRGVKRKRRAWYPFPEVLFGKAIQNPEVLAVIVQRHTKWEEREGL